MRYLLSKRGLCGLVLAAMVAYSATLSVAAQSAAPKKVPKSSTGSSHSSAKTSTGKKSSTSGKKPSKKNVGRVKGQAAPTPERISEIQQALAKNGSYDGAPSGKWDDSTIDATKKFQSAHGLNPSGKLDAPTLQKLGLGSETAGLGAPVPPPNSTSNRLIAPNSHHEEEKNLQP
jgi:hypothetical protein